MYIPNTNNKKMSVIKRDGRIEAIDFEKIHRRITTLMNKEPKLNNIDHITLTQKIIKILRDNITTIELDEEAARLSSNMEPIHLDYGTLSVRISVSNLHKNTNNSFSEMIKVAYSENGISDYMYYICYKYGDIIDKEINSERDYNHTYIGLRTFERLYGLKDKNGKVIDRPSYMWMRVALALFKSDIITCKDYKTNYLERFSTQTRNEYFIIDKEHSESGIERRIRHIDINIDDIDWESINNSLDTLYADHIKSNFERAFKLYNYMSQSFCTKATPILFNAGTRTENFISCYLKALSNDSVNEMYLDNVEIANLFKSAGGVGYHLHNLRSQNSLINSSNGRAEGIVPFARSLNCTSRHIKQGGRRNGSISLYLGIWHADIIDFLNLKRPQGEENARARDLFYGLWIPDLYMNALCKNDWWYLMSPDECPGLSDVHNEAFNKLYKKYVDEGRYRIKIKAQALWKIIQEIRIESGSPYLLASDSCNSKSNQQNLGTIKSSNLCVSPDTLILTDQGNKQIKELKDQSINIWNGFEWSKVIIKQTGINQKMIKIKFSNGSEIKCTKYHKFHIVSLTGYKIIEADKLKPGNQLIEHIWPNGEKAKSISIISIEDLKECSDTYCFNEPLNHTGIFNNIICGNCSEIVLYSSPEETADCVLCSIALNEFTKINTNDKIEIDFDKLGQVVELEVDALNMVIDNNNYINHKTKISNERHRPIGIGVQGLADLFIKLRLPFDSIESRKINIQIFETMYYYALKRSMELAKIYGPYSSFDGSPTSQGKLQFDLWGINIQDYTTRPELNWELLRSNIIKYGLRNSTLIALMPTATTSIILGNSSCFEPLISNIYKKKTLAGEFTIINKFLVQDLMNLGLWNNKMYEAIKNADGSIQYIKEIPEEIKQLYKTVWEMKQKTIVDMCVDRGPFICQSQSMNLFFAEPNEEHMTKAAIYAWAKGLKTLCYYTRTQKASNAIKYTVSIADEPKEEIKTETKKEYVCTDDVCIMCQS